MSKSLEELKNEKLRELSSGFDQNNNINVFSKWSYEEGWKDAIKAVSDREKKDLNEKALVDIITEWKHFWMNQKQNNQQDYENYFRRASGIDANMKYDLAKRICEALKEHGG